MHLKYDSNALRHNDYWKISEFHDPHSMLLQLILVLRRLVTRSGYSSIRYVLPILPILVCTDKQPAVILGACFEVYL